MHTTGSSGETTLVLHVPSSSWAGKRWIITVTSQEVSVESRPHLFKSRLETSLQQRKHSGKLKEFGSCTGSLSWAIVTSATACPRTAGGRALPPTDSGNAEWLSVNILCQETDWHKSTHCFIHSRPVCSVFDCPAQTGFASDCALCRTTTVLEGQEILISFGFVQLRVFLCHLALLYAHNCFQATGDSVFCCVNKTVM